AADPVEYVVAETDFSQYTVQTTKLDRALYLPPECDVSIRKGWFWADDDQPKSLDHLLGIHYRSIGMGANLLLNLPPDSRGLIRDEDERRLREWRRELDRGFAEPITARLRQVGPGRWSATFTDRVRLDHLVLVEDYSTGQRIRSHKIVNGDGDDGTVIAEGLTVGNKRIHVFAEIETDGLMIIADGERPRLESAVAYSTGVSAVPRIDYRASTDEA